MKERPIRDKENTIIFGAPRIEKEETDEVVDCLKSGWLGTGPKTALFEKEFASYKKAENSMAVNSCTAALHLALIASQIEPGDEVITTPMTFCATINAIIHSGGTPVLADVDQDTMNISPEEIEKKITSRTRAILPVHFAGRPCDMKRICDIAKERNLKIIEDCAHAIEGQFMGQPVGTFGDFGCFSFYVTKNITTGEGGMVLAKDKNDIARIKTLALHGMSDDAWHRFSDKGYKHYRVTEAGFKFNMMDIQAAIGLHQLKKINSFRKRREEIWEQYNKAFKDLPIRIPAPPQTDTTHAYHLYTIMIDEKKTGISRDEFLSKMNSHNIGTGVHYQSIPEHPFYRDTFGWKREDYPNAMLIGRQTASLPLSALLEDDDVNDIIAATTQILSGS